MKPRPETTLEQRLHKAAVRLEREMVEAARRALRTRKDLVSLNTLAAFLARKDARGAQRYLDELEADTHWARVRDLHREAMTRGHKESLTLARSRVKRAPRVH